MKQPIRQATYFSPKFFLRIAAGCILFFAAGHSIGHFTRYAVKDHEAQKVLQAMTHKFDMFGQLRSYDENYTGMSLNLLMTLLTLATFLLILAGNLEKADKGWETKLLYPVALCTIGFSITSFLYFFLLPGITCMLASLLILYAILLLNRNTNSHYHS